MRFFDLPRASASSPRFPDSSPERILSMFLTIRYFLKSELEKLVPKPRFSVDDFTITQIVLSLRICVLTCFYHGYFRAEPSIVIPSSPGNFWGTFILKKHHLEAQMPFTNATHETIFFLKNDSSGVRTYHPS